MEAMLLLATLGQRGSIRHDPRREVRLQPLVSLRPRDGMPIFPERRA